MPQLPPHLVHQTTLQTSPKYYPLTPQLNTPSNTIYFPYERSSPAQGKPNGGRFKWFNDDHGHLRLTHLVAGIVHGLQVVVLLLVGFLAVTDGFHGRVTIDSPFEYTVSGTEVEGGNLTDGYEGHTMTYHEGIDEERSTDLLKAHLMFTWSISRSVFFFLFVSSFFHFVQVFWKGYIEKVLDRFCNFIRWIEYALGASFMTILISQLCNIQDFWLLTHLVLQTILMMVFGYLMEVQNPRQKVSTDGVTWFSHIIGWIPFTGIWGTIIYYFVESVYAVRQNNLDIPNEVYAIVVILALFYGSFGCVQIGLYLKLSKDNRKNETYYMRSEYAYIVLSLVSKTILAWLVIGGSFRSNGE